MAKFVELDEAARMLGVTPETLVEMRSNGQIRGFRDGTSWKFKEDEVDRARAELGSGGGGSTSYDDADDELTLGSETGEDEPADDSVLVNEQELGTASPSKSSTIIGHGNQAAGEDSDLALAGEEGSDLSLDSGSELPMAAGSGSELGLDEGSEVDLSGDSELSLVAEAGGGSDVSLVPDPGSDKEIPTGGGSGVLGSDLELQSASGGGTGDLELGEDEDSLESDLALSDDDDMVLSGTGSGSELSLSAGDSGINLGSPSDSGLSLEADSGISLQSPTDSGLSLEEDSLDMGGSSISSLELPEDDEVSLDDTDSGVQQDEQFMLSPSDEMFTDESDSGSQVIALEDSEAFDQDALSGDQALLAESSGLDTQLDALGAGTAAAPVMGRGGYSAELPEAPYSIWNLLGLIVITLFLSLCGILMIDIVRNMWGWEEGRDVSTGISEALTAPFEP